MTAEAKTRSEEVIRAAVDSLKYPPEAIMILIAEYKVAIAQNLALEKAIHALTKPEP